MLEGLRMVYALEGIEMKWSVRLPQPGSPAADVFQDTAVLLL